MAKGSSIRGTGSTRSSSVASRGSAARSNSNSRMWSQPATARQISALKAHGNFDGKFYSKGRAGQAIGESVRAAGSAAAAAQPLAGSLRAGRGRQSALEAVTVPAAGPARIGAPDPAPMLRENVAALPATLPTQLAPAPAGGQPSEWRAGSLWFALFDELEERHLSEFQREHVWGGGDNLRIEVKAWSQLRVKLAKRLAEAHVELVTILHEAPPGSLPDPAATASRLLAAGSPHGLEGRHLREFQREHTWGRGDNLRTEVKAWVNSRIDLALTNARAVVDLLNAQDTVRPMAPQPALPAAPGPARATGRGELCARPDALRLPRRRSVPAVRARTGRTYLATVVRINPHGAVVSLDSGEQGWLHVSQLRALNGGARVESVSDILEVGQQVRTRGIGATDRGQVRLALAGATASAKSVPLVPTTAKQDASEVPAVPIESTGAAAPRAPKKRRGLLARLAPGRPMKEKP